MDIQLVDANSTHRNVMQAYELEEVLDYAAKWMEISNDKEKNHRVNVLIRSIKKSITDWNKTETIEVN